MKKLLEPEFICLMDDYKQQLIVAGGFRRVPELDKLLTLRYCCRRGEVCTVFVGHSCGQYFTSNFPNHPLSYVASQFCPI